MSLEALRGLSERLRAFVVEMPYERGPILSFIKAAADGIPPGSRVLDVGAGDAPYAELFDHVEYITSDWEASVHEGARAADVIAPAEALPLTTPTSTSSCAPRCSSTCRAHSAF